ncbi:MAG: energy transducer TonB [Bryobacteraceae bacterium]|nr:energy transducer TonB [Bryobacteraceae bacterium]
MIAQHEELEQEMNVDRTSSGAPVLQPNDNLDRLLLAETDKSWFQSFSENVRELINPPKLPPLEVTSKPVPVKDIWGGSANKGRAGVSSLLIHMGFVTALLVIGTNKTVQEKAREAVTLVMPLDIDAYKPAPIKKDLMGGGGGGGNRNPLPASQGKLPKIAKRQFVPPSAEINNPNPKLVMEPTIIVQSDANLPQITANNYGLPTGIPGPPSNGSGSGGGIGSGRGGGVGSGTGAGFGPGSGGGTGGGVYRIGGGVSSPIPIYKPEPEYSEEARKAKFQGAVLLSIVILPDGSTTNIRVVRPLGLGLDEKAIEAVQKWKFKPSLKDGKPVAVSANVEVNFRLL